MQIQEQVFSQIKSKSNQSLFIHHFSNDCSSKRFTLKIFQNLKAEEQDKKNAWCVCSFTDPDDTEIWKQDDPQLFSGVIF